MERLKVGVGDPYDPIEASLHVGRYALALPFAAGRRVLDVACGEGYGSWLLTDSGAAEVVGVDISSDAINKARTTFRHNRLRFETSAGEALSQLLPLAHFDLVVSLETIEHVADPEAFLLALRQVATPDAIFVLTCPNDLWYYGDREGNPHHLRRFTFDQFKSLTVKFLGSSVRWLLGSPTLGFAAVSADQGEHDQAERSKYTQVFPSRLTLRVPSGESGPSVSDVSYFIGVWNAPDLVDGAGAYQAISMDYYSKMMWTATSMEQLAELNGEVSALRSQYDEFAKEIAASNIERASLAAELDGLRANLHATQAALDAKAAALTVEVREREILSVQAAALRRENEILSLLSGEVTALRSQHDEFVKEIAASNIERASLSAELDGLRANLHATQAAIDVKAAALTVEVREKEILSVQAAALRRENEILSSQLVAMRTALASAEHQQKDLQTSLANEREIKSAEVATLAAERDVLQTSLEWHIARVVSLEDALNWHVARVAGLDEALASAEHQQKDLQTSLANEREIKSAEVATLAAERDVLQTSLEWHIARVVSLEDALNWHVARVASLDEALSGQVARVRNLESEGPRRLVKRALCRTLDATPPLARLVSRLRGHGATQAKGP